MKKIFAGLFFIFFFVTFIRASAASPPSISAEGAILVDTSSGRILYEKNKDALYYPASTTKIMTALLVLENCKLDDKVIIGKNPSSFVDGSKIYIFLGEELTVEQLLHALLIESANDVALALAEHVSGSQEAFAELMNQRAMELGCKNTHFVNPHGLHDENHYTTAYDLSLIAREAMKNQTFRRIVSTKSYTIEPTNKQKERRYFHLRNHIINDGRYHVEGADGVKTGFTNEAGHTFVGSAVREDSRFIVVLMRDKKPALWDNASKLLDYAFNNFKTERELIEGQTVTTLKDSSNGFELPLSAETDFYATVPLHSAKKVDTKVVITNHRMSNIISGQNMGYVEFSIGGSPMGRVNLRASKDSIPAISYNYRLESGDTLSKKNSSYIVATATGVLAAVIFIGAILIRSKKRINKGSF